MDSAQSSPLDDNLLAEVTDSQGVPYSDYIDYAGALTTAETKQGNTPEALELAKYGNAPQDFYSIYNPEFMTSGGFLFSDRNYDMANGSSVDIPVTQRSSIPALLLISTALRVFTQAFNFKGSTGRYEFVIQSLFSILLGFVLSSLGVLFYMVAGLALGMGGESQEITKLDKFMVLLPLIIIGVTLLMIFLGSYTLGLRRIRNAGGSPIAYLLFNACYLAVPAHLTLVNFISSTETMMWVAYRLFPFLYSIIIAFPIIFLAFISKAKSKTFRRKEMIVEKELLILRGNSRNLAKEGSPKLKGVLTKVFLILTVAVIALVILGFVVIVAISSYYSFA